MGFEGKVALITGGGSGIGRASALALAAQGAKVVVADVNVEGGDETVHRIKDGGGEAFFVQADVSAGAQVAAMVQKTVDTFGRLDCAVNNAGISGGGMMARVADIEEEIFDRTIAVNLKGVWLCMKYELPVMVQQGGGVIVNMASVAGLIGSPKGAAYSASKHGVIGLTRTAALDYAKYKIRVNAVCPAYTDTPMVSDVIESNPAMGKITAQANPMKRLGRPEEIAEGVLWLCSDAASFVTGHALAMDGGLTAI